MSFDESVSAIIFIRTTSSPIISPKDVNAVTAVSQDTPRIAVTTNAIAAPTATIIIIILESNANRFFVVSVPLRFVANHQHNTTNSSNIAIMPVNMTFIFSVSDKYVEATTIPIATPTAAKSKTNSSMNVSCFLSNFTPESLSAKYPRDTANAIIKVDKPIPAANIDCGSLTIAIAVIRPEIIIIATSIVIKDLTLILSPYCPASHMDVPKAMSPNPIIPADCNNDSLSGISDIIVISMTTAAIAPVNAHIVEAFTSFAAFEAIIISEIIEIKNVMTTIP